jgi:hypothetical protein
MRYLLPVILLASVAWGAAHDTASRVSGHDAVTSAEASCASDPLWRIGDADQSQRPHPGSDEARLQEQQRLQ